MSNRKAWEKVLKMYCTADPITGNRPCDSGLLCDKCIEGFEFKHLKGGYKNVKRKINQKSKK